ncbi:MAG: hypothetical protein ACHREM_09135 [Polyangiales bacterium]
MSTTIVPTSPSAASDALRDVAALLRQIQYPGGQEKVVQQVAYEHLLRLGLAVEREVALGGGMIVDLIATFRDVGVRVGVEMKVDGAEGATLRQLHGYASSGQLDALLLASTSRRLAHSLGRHGGRLGGIAFDVVILPTRLA